jgi:polyphosphate kinase
MSEAQAVVAGNTPAGVTSNTPAGVLQLLNRERAILQFNRRVLAQAQRADVPLLERLRYVTIVSSNLDEFFEVRVADIIEATRRPDSGVTRADLAAIDAAAHELTQEQYGSALAYRSSTTRSARRRSGAGCSSFLRHRCSLCWCP